MRIVYEYDGNDEVSEQITDQTVNDLLATAEDVAAANEADLEDVNLRFVTGKIPTDNDILAVVGASLELALVTA